MRTVCWVYNSNGGRVRTVCWVYSSNGGRVRTVCWVYNSNGGRVSTVDVLIAQFRSGFSKKNNNAYLRGHVLPSVLTVAAVSQRCVGIFVIFGMGVLYKRFSG